MQAVNYYIVVEKIKEAPTKIGGLELTDEITDNRYNKGKTISVGNLVQGVKNNDIIYYDRHAGYGIEHEGEHLFVIKEQDVVVVLWE